MSGLDGGFVLLSLGMDVDTQPQALEDKLDSLKAELEKQSRTLMSLDELHKSRRCPLVDTIHSLTVEIRHLEEVAKLSSSVGNDMPPGPSCLSWIESSESKLICNIVIFADLVMVVIHCEIPGKVYHVISNFILVFYMIELVLMIIYHQRNFFLGPWAIVWWSWLDLIIVCSGMFELWLVPFLEDWDSQLLGGHHHMIIHMRIMRLLRLFRLLKAIKLFLNLQPSIVMTREFDLFMNGVIFFNAIVMGFSLDVRWWGWYWIDQAFLLVYVVELIARAKYLRWSFFVDAETRSWNYLDLALVGVGVFEQWLTPMIELVSNSVSGDSAIDLSGLGNVTQLFRFMRLFRVLRLAKLLKSIPPLHRLLLGVMKALESMKWVMALTALVLYSAAIVFTNLVTKGIIEDSEGLGHAHFGTVQSSLFSLFMLMNGDTEIADCLTGLFIGKVLFVCFMVLANWALLGILTAVVSDNMIRSSFEVVEKEKEAQEEAEKETNRARIQSIFMELDADRSGFLEENEWSTLLTDPGLRSVFLDASDLRERDLKHLFDCLADEMYNEKGEVVKYLDYEELLNALQTHNQLVDHRALMRLTARLIRIEKICLNQPPRGSKLRAPSKSMQAADAEPVRRVVLL